LYEDVAHLSDWQAAAGPYNKAPGVNKERSCRNSSTCITAIYGRLKSMLLGGPMMMIPSLFG
jgi:hypothetical protein